MELKTKSSKEITIWKIVVCFGLFAMVGLNNGAAGVLVPELSRSYQLDISIVGLLYLGGDIGYAVSAFLSGRLVASLGLRSFVVAGLIVFVLSCLLLVLAPPFAIVFVIRAALGFGTAIMESSGNFYIATLPKNTTLLNYLHSFFGAGSLIGPLVATFVLAMNWGWSSVYLVWLLMTLPLFLGCLIYFPAIMPRNQEELTSSNKTEGGRKLMSATLAIPSVWIGSTFLVVYVGIELGVGAWAYTLLTEFHHYDFIFSGWAVSGYWLGLTIGRIILAPLIERIGWGNKELIQIGMVLAVIGGVIVWASTNDIVTALGLGLLGLGLGPTFPTILAILVKLVPTELVPSTIGFASSLSILGGAVFLPLAGFLMDKFGIGFFMPYMGLLGLVTIGVWRVFVKQLNDD